MTPTVIELERVAVRFANAERAVIDDFSLTIPQGEFVSLVGPSGCGKSTLLKLLAGLISPTSGRVLRGSSEGLGNRTGFVFQHPTLLPWRTAEANLQLPMELGKSQARRALTSVECQELLQQVGLLASDARKLPSQLSGGMQMRLSLARALATQPEILLLDEPFASVDDLLRLRLQEDLRHLHDERHLTSVLVTHNLQEAVFLSDRVVVLSGSPSRVGACIRIDTTMSRNSAFRDASQFFDYLRTVSSALFQTPSKVRLADD